MTDDLCSRHKLTDAQRDFMRDGEEGVFCDRRIARALCGKGLMGVAGYVLGETCYAFTHEGLAVREALRARQAMKEQKSNWIDPAGTPNSRQVSSSKGEGQDHE